MEVEEVDMVVGVMVEGKAVVEDVLEGEVVGGGGSSQVIS